MKEGSNKLNKGVNTTYTDKETFNYLRYGEVKSVDDPQGLGRIKVYIKGLNINGGDDETLKNNGIDGLPWCTPLLPKHLQVTPKIGEGVFVFSFSKEREHLDRLFIGPLISSPIKLNKDEARTTAPSGLSFGPFNPPVSVDTIPELNGVFPNKEDVSIQGRYNTDITQKNNEILIRAGKFITKTVTDNTNNPFNIKFNNINQGFIQIKNDVKLSTDDNAKYGSVTNIVSNRINLIAQDGSPRFSNLPNQDDYISENQLQEILKNAHQVPFGDILLEYLILLKEAFLSHVHNGNGNVATDLSPKTSVINFSKKASDLEQRMLSKNIRIN